MLFHSFRIPTEDGRSLTTHWKEEHTGRVVAVSLMRLFQQRDAMHNCMEDTQELQELVELFPQVPVMSISGEFLRDEELLRMGEPLARRKVIVMVLQLLPPGAEAYVILDDEIEK
ncbi:hypothetical protein MRX96_014429 [Rhipicephalus microplus]